MDDNVYEVGRALFRNMLKVARKAVKPIGVYCVEKDGTAVMLNKKAPNKAILNKQIEKYEKEGFKVYFNG